MKEIDPNSLVNFEDLNVDCGPAVWPYLQLPAKKALAKAIAERGTLMVVNSAYRTIAQQQVLFNHFKGRKCGIPDAAIPPTSNHQSGLAIDIQDPFGWKPFWKGMVGSIYLMIHLTLISKEAALVTSETWQY